MTPTQYVIIGLAVLLGTFVQASVGFGAGLFAIPIIIWAGVRAPSAIAIALAVVLCQTVWSCIQHWEDVPWRESLPMSGLRHLFMPVGVALLVLIMKEDKDLVKQVLGVFLLLVVVSQWALRVKPRAHVHGGWLLLAGSLSGLFAGGLGMGGPPAVLWVMAHDWPSRKSRAFLWVMMGQIMPAQMALYVWWFGVEVAWAALLGFAYLPVAVAGALLGAKLGAKLSRQRLRVAAFVLLIMLALASIIGPMVS